MKNNFPCKCGHTFKDHDVFKSYSYSYILPKACLVGVGSITGYIDDCSEFKQDNLKYLEQLYDKNSR